MMKGAFEIEVVRGGRRLNLDFDNRILKSGIDFQYNFSVNNTTDSIVTDLFIGGTHSVIDENTTGMSINPLTVVKYSDYITPDFSDETAELFTNSLVFRFEPETTMVIRQLGTGRKDVINIGGVDSDKYSYFSLANLRDAQGNLAELTVYQGDVITITYTVTIFNYVNFGDYNFGNKDIVWNMLRANPNWQLCGFARKMQLAKVALSELWGATFEPFIISNTVGETNSNQTYYQYLRLLNTRNITVGWNVGALTAADLTDPKYKKYISMAGPLPYWQINYSLYYGTKNGVNYTESYTGTMARVANTELKVFDPENKYPVPKPTITEFSQNISWGQYQSSIKISAKVTPFSAVMFTYKGKIYPLNHNGDSKSIVGYSDKTGYWYAYLPIQEMIAATVQNDRFGGSMFITAMNDSGMTKSEVLTLTGSRYGLKPSILLKTKSTDTVNGSVVIGIQSLYTDTSGSMSATRIDASIIRNGDRTNLITTGDFYHGTGNYWYDSNYFNSSFTVKLNSGEIDYFDGTYSILLTSNGLFYELPIGTSESLNSKVNISAGLYGATKPHISAGNQGLSDIVHVDLKFTKLS